MRAAALAGLVWASADVAQGQTAEETTDAAVRAALWCVAKAEEAFRPVPEPSIFDEFVAQGPEGFQVVFGQMSMTWMFHPAPAGDDAAVMIFGIPGQCGGQRPRDGRRATGRGGRLRGCGLCPCHGRCPRRG